MALFDWQWRVACCRVLAVERATPTQQTTNQMTNKLELPREIEIETAELWLASGAIEISHIGNENTYYLNEFGHAFMCKNYPA